MIDHSNTVETADRPEKSASKDKHKALKIILLTFLLIVFTPILLIGTLAIKNPLYTKAAINFIKADTTQISSESNRVNILIMGKSGGSHDGPDLTDTMILASVSLNNPSIKTVSIPRDIWVPSMLAKVNSAYYWGKTGSAYIDSTASGGGIGLAKKIVGEITGLPIQYGVVIDFSSFKDIVDALGGITVNVQNSFTDKLYPIEGRENDTCGGKDPNYLCRYETITFNQGIQNMDGETALKFVRSRHADGDEGTDLAREVRQQKVIGAIKEKMLTPKTFLSIKTDLKLLNIVQRYVETDLSLPSAGTLARFVLKGSNNISQLSIPEDFLVVPKTDKLYDNLYVFIPKAGNGNWKDINEWFASSLAN